MKRDRRPSRPGTNPFRRDADPDRRAIWEMLVARDSEAFVARNWARVEGDFARDRFEGIHAHGSADPEDWTLAYPTVDDYRADWLKGAGRFLRMPLRRLTHRELIRKMTRLDRIAIAGDRALAWKRFSAREPLRGGGRYAYAARSLYRLHRIAGRWKIAGFVGYLPYV